MALKYLGRVDISEKELKELEEEEEDYKWWSEKVVEFEQKFKGKYLAIINKEVHIGDSFQEAYQKAKEKYPGREPIVEYIPYKKEILVL